MSKEAEFPFIKEGVVTYAVDSLLQAATYMQRPPCWQSEEGPVEHFAGAVNNVPDYAQLLHMHVSDVYSFNHWGILRFDPDENERSLTYYSLLSGLTMQKTVINRSANDPSFTDIDYFPKIVQRSGSFILSSLDDAEHTDYLRIVRSLFALRPIVQVEAERIHSDGMNTATE